MAQFFTDFSEYTTGVAASDWTEVGSASNQSNTVETAVPAVSFGGQGLNFVLSGGDQTVLTWDEVDSLSADVDIVGRFHTTDATGSQMRIIARNSGADGSETHYALVDDAGANQIQIVEFTNGNSGANLDTAAFTSVSSTYYWMRFRVNGATQKGKIWADGDVEPEAWMVEATDATITAAGRQGIGAFTSSGTKYWDVFSVATAGDRAKMPARTIPTFVEEHSVPLVNGDFETGDFTGWDLAVGTALIETTNAITGTYSAEGGSNEVSTQIDQQILTSAIGVTDADIDNGKAYLEFTANAYSDPADTEDELRLFTTFLTGADAQIGLHTRDGDGNYSAITPIGYTMLIPPLTRKINFGVVFTRRAGSENNGIVDDLAARVIINTDPIIDLPFSSLDAETTDGWLLDSGSGSLLTDNTRTPAEGTSFFKHNAADGVFRQRFALTDFFTDSELDAGILQIIFQHSRASFSNDDKSQVGFQFRDSAEAAVGGNLYGPLHTVAPGLQSVDDITSWRECAHMETIPATARYVDLLMHFDRFDGSNSDGYIDDIKIHVIALANPSPPANDSRAFFFFSP